ncbi:MAG: hypothetical protein KGI71_03205 [Patescibacteria group bacterium]|nr:hypothetical protein [Patescibacteria group bacterium]
MNIKSISAVVVMALAGCTAGSLPTSVDLAKSIAEGMVYSKDPRTGLCFGVTMATTSGRNYVVATNVPCDKVAKYLDK